MASSGEWTCICRFINSFEKIECEKCGRSVIFDEESMRFQKWHCSMCTYLNSADQIRCAICYNIKEENVEEDYWELPDYENVVSSEEELRIILVGRTGAGKSATGNAILGSKIFESSVSCSSLTKECQRGWVKRCGRIVQVVDTPGLFDTEMNNDEVIKEILKCVGLSAPGPHAILLVVGVGRFTEEERETVRLLQKAFGDNMTKYLTVVFTRKDDLDHGKKTVHDMVRESPRSLREFLDECDNRYYAINNNADKASKEEQTEELLKIINTVVQKNGGDFYKSTIFNEADRIIQQRITEKEKEQKYKVAKICRGLSEEYHEHDRQAGERAASLHKQLQLLEEERDKENAKLHELMGKLDDLHDDTDENNMFYEENDRIKYLKKRILCVKKKLSDIQTDRREAFSNSYVRGHEVTQCYQRWNPREEVRNEIEKGDATILKNIWKSIYRTGIELRRRFLSLFETLKKKAEFHR